MLDFRETYSRMSDDELLDLALEVESLTSTARMAFHVEMQRRHLGAAAITEHVEVRRAAKLEAEGRPVLARNLGPFGTELVGARHFESDGSFLTTKWIILFWFPFFPLKSLRIRYLGPRGRGNLFSGWSSGYVVCSEHPIDVGQVVSTYAFVALFFVGRALLNRLHADSLFVYAAFGIWTCVPTFLQWQAKRKVMPHP